MAQFIIHGPAKLKGIYRPSGAKNAALKMIAAALLTKEKITLRNCPLISDVDTLKKLVEELGAQTRLQNHTLEIEAKNIHSSFINDNLAAKIRASIVLVGPLLGRLGRARIINPGGCLIGKRPLDTHFEVIRQFGVKISSDKKHYFFSIDKLKGKIIILPELSVTATENAILTAVLAEGKSQIRVAAAEPEISDLISLLNKMGAKISGSNSHTLRVTGVKKLHGANHAIIPDRIEIGTIISAALATKSQLTIKNIIAEHLDNFLIRLKTMGAKFSWRDDDLTVYPSDLQAVKIDTRPYPGFPTDLQSPVAALMTQAVGTSRIFETLFEGRFNYVDDLQAMGAKIKMENDYIVAISGPTPLQARHLECSDLRAGAALVIAGLIAKGKTVINNIELIERGYERLDEKLAKIGAKIKRAEKC